MSSDRKWNYRVRHIAEAIDRILQYTAGKSFERFSSDQLVIDAVIRNFQVLGEASRHIPADVEAAHPEIPWADMRKMRHVLVHDYDKVKLDVVWATIQHDLPPIVEPLKQFLAEIQRAEPQKPASNGD